MNLPRFSLKYPYAVLALVLVVAVMGSIAYVVIPTDLFPETVPPQVAVITVEPGASAKDIADKVTRNIEKELGSLAGLKRITSVSRDEVSSVTAEFLFSKPMGEAVIDVQNAVARVKGILPSDIREPLLYRITDATRPLLTLAMSPGPASLKRLADIRLLAENDIRDALMAVPGVGDVQVFGGHVAEIEIRVDQNALAGHGMTITDVITGLARQNVAAPGGIVYGARQEYLLKISGELSGLRSFEEMPLGTGSDDRILLRDVAEVKAAESDPRSRYHGNGKEAIAVNVLRPERGNTVNTLTALKKTLPRIKADYPDILIEITDDQQPLIDISVRGMRSSLWQAVILTVCLIFIFLADLRAAAVVSAAIPLSFLAALVVLWISPYTLNMVTLSGLIVAVGMVVDASVVVLENIHRHHRETGYADAIKAALTGASEVALPITAGMLTTVAVLVPVIFTSGYTGRTMRPLNIAIVATLVASLIVSLTVIPILAARFFSIPGKGPNLIGSLLKPFGKGVELLTHGYERLVTLALRFRWLTVLIFLIFTIFSLRVVKPLLGGEQMPPMDTGIVTIQFDTDSSAKPYEVNQVLSRIEAIVKKHPAVLTISSVMGSEPGAISFGGGEATSQSANITVGLTPRTQRAETIWSIEKKWRKALQDLPGVRTFRISEYGATPVSTTKAPFNAILSGPDPLVLNSLADKTIDLLNGTPGLIDLRRSWYIDKIEQKIIVDPLLAQFYGTSPAEAAAFLRVAVQGVFATTMRLDGFYDLPIRVRYRTDQIDDLGRLEELFVPTRSGPVRLGNLAKIITVRTQPFITRENQHATIDITAGNSGLTIAQANGAAKKRLAGLSLPRGYALNLAGTAQDMAETQVSLGSALVVGLALLFILLLAMFKSLSHPLTIILSIPLAAAGGVWGLLLFDKPFCMPALMGFILLGGTIVNNAILMLDFIIEARKKGLKKDEAILQSVRLRLRPILITAVSTIVGFSPLIFETAVGLERMSPLGIAAASGLLVGTIVTLVAVPVIYSLLDSLKQGLSHTWTRKKLVSGTLVILLMALLFSAPAKVWAKTNFPVPLTLDEAVRIALEHNPDLETARAEIDVRQAEIMAAEASQGIHLDLIGQGAWSDRRHAQIPGLNSKEQGFADLQCQGILSANWLITDFGKTEAQLRSVLNLHKAEVSLEQRKQQQIIYLVSLQYLKALTITDLLDAVSGTRDSLQTFAQLIDSQISAGRAPEIDALKINIRLAEVESRLADLKRDLQISRAALARIMGVEEELPPLTPGSVPEIVAEDTERTMLLEVNDRLDIVAQELMVQAGREKISASERESLPKIELFATSGIYGANDPETGTGEVDDDPWKSDSTGGIRLTLPLLDNGLRKSKLAKSRAELQKARAALHAMQLAAKQEIIEARAGVTSARSKIVATQKSVVYAKKVVQIEQLKYRIGRGTSAEVLEAETALLNADSLSRQSGRELSMALLAQHLALGGSGINFFGP